MTGDRVTLTEYGPVITPGRDRHHIGFGTIRDGDHALVIPSDALPRLARGEISAEQLAVGRPRPAAVAASAAAFELAIHVLDRNGNPGIAGVIVTAADGSQQSAFPSPDAPDVAFQLEAGQYAVDMLASVDASFESDPVMMAYPRLDLQSDVSLTFDTRTTRVPQVRAPGPQQVFGTDSSYEDLASGHRFGLNTFGSLKIGQLGPDLPAGALRASAVLVLADDVEVPSEITQLAHAEHGHLVRDWNETIAPGQLATVIADHAGTNNNIDLADKRSFAFDAEGNQLGSGFDMFVETPFALTEHYDVRARWLTELFGTIFGPSQTRSRQLRSYEGGQRYREHWNRAPFGPALPVRLTDTGSDPSSAARRGDTLMLYPALFAAQGERDDGAVSRFSATLRRDGNVVSDVSANGDIALPPSDVPPDTAVYQLAASATRDAPLSSAVSATWTFRSRHGDAVLPLPVVRFEPVLDDHNTSHARALAIPIRVERPAGAPRAPITQLRVDASFDDGATWTRVPVIGGELAIALIVHPAGAQAVSLRATAGDARGNRVEQQITRAYLLAH